MLTRIRARLKMLVPKALKIILHKVHYLVALTKRGAVFLYHRLRGESIYTNRYHHDSGVNFFVPNLRSFERARYAHQKEPITRRFISDIPDGATFWDIGSNIGVFGILAAKRGIRTVCFEPLASNYFALSKNVELNPATFDRIVIVPLALTNASGVETLYCPTTEAGYSGVQFGRTVDERGNEFRAQVKINLLGMSGSAVNEVLPHGFRDPTHIKLDVDGIELEILHGLGPLLSSANLRAVLVEVNLGVEQNLAAITQLMSENGLFNHPKDREQTVLGHRNASCFNYIFRRA